MEKREAITAQLRLDHARHLARNQLAQWYPDSGPLRRELYAKHLGFFADGATHTERAIIAANRSGKSTAAGYEMACHLTGKYPHWWVGRRFERSITAWAAGEDAKSVRESLQVILFGALQQIGTGMIPGDDIVDKPAMARGAVDLIDSCAVKHVAGGASRLVLKSYEQGRESFQAAGVNAIWLDEEPPKDIYTEALTRVMSTVPGEPNGALFCTFTPLSGMSEVVMDYLGEDWRRPDVNA